MLLVKNLKRERRKIKEYKMFVISFNKLDKKAAQNAYNGLKKWFKDNPKRKVCRTDLFVVRKASLKEDILKNSVAGTKFKD